MADRGGTATTVCMVTSITAALAQSAGCFCQPKVSTLSFTVTTHITRLTCRCCTCLARQGINLCQLLQMHRLVAEVANDKATLASQVKIFLTLGCSERKVCMHRYVHASAYGGMLKTSLNNVVWGFAFINHSHSAQVREGQCPWEVTQGKKAM